MRRRHVRPADGLSILDPRTKRVVPPDGQWVPDDSYWRRRLRVGDCIEATPAPEAGTAAQPGSEPATDPEE